MKYKNSMKKWRCLPALLLCVVLSVPVCVTASENAAQSEFEIEDGVLVHYTGDADDTDAAGTDDDGTLYDKVDIYDYGKGYYYGIYADGGFMVWDSEELTLDNDHLAMCFQQVTKGEEIEKYEAAFGGEAALYSFKLYENGVPKTLGNEITVGFNLQDNMMGFYGKLYRVEDDGTLTELRWLTGNYLDWVLVGFYAWQCYRIYDDTLGTYVPGNYLIVAPHTFGDVDYDDAITASDALEVLQMVVGLRACDGMMEITADANGDGEVSAADALEILEYAVGLDTLLSAWSKVPC